MQLDVIIPCYYRSDIIRPNLAKLAQQTIVDDITLIMVNDCSPFTDCEYQDLIDEFQDKLHIRYFKTAHNSGPGVARQLGMDNAIHDWIMFIDDDDELFDEYSAELLMKLAKENPQAVSITGQSVSVNVDDLDNLNPVVNEPWLHHHGSIYNRKMLVENNICFDERLSYREEDGAFSSCILFTLPNVQHITVHELVYIKKFSHSYTSLTSKPVDINNLLNFIGLKCVELKYIESHKSHYTSYEQVFVIANIFNFLINETNYPLTEAQYKNFLSLLSDIEPYIDSVYHQMDYKSCESCIKIYNEAFPDASFGVFTYENVDKYFTNRHNWLKKLEERIVK